MFCNEARVFVPGKPFQPCLVFVGKASNLPKSGAPFTGCIFSHVRPFYERVVSDLDP